MSLSKTKHDRNQNGTKSVHMCKTMIYTLILYYDNNDGERTLFPLYLCNSLINTFDISQVPSLPYINIYVRTQSTSSRRAA